MRFNGGWVRIDRKLFSMDKQNNPFYGDPILCTLWVRLICMANYVEGKTRSKNESMPVRRGELVTSAKELANAVGTTPRIVRNRLRFLEKESCIKSSTSNAGMLITILNYSEYQDVAENRSSTSNAEGKVGVTQRSSGGKVEVNILNKVTREQQNNGTIKDKPTSRKPSLVLTPSEIAISTDWLKYNQDVQPSSQATVQSIGEDLAKLKRVVEITDAQGQKQKLGDDHLRGILEFLKEDDFWRDKASSTKTLLNRRLKGGPRKIDNILAQIKIKVTKNAEFNTYMKNPLEE